MAEATLKLLMLGEDRSAGKTLRSVGNEASKSEGRLSKMSKVAGTLLVSGLAAGAAAMVKFGGQASDLAETQSKVTQIFGKDSAAALDKFADSAARNLGQSKQTALDAAATFGIIGKSAGKSGDDLVGFSTQMATLAGDMASFNNTTPEEAIEAIGAAMRGEAEPIRKYGVLLDDATLRAEALKLGLIKTTKEALTPQQKALAAQAAILRQTKDQQGDFARTSDGLANKQRILKAELTNLSTELGAKALPAMVAFTGALTTGAEFIDENRTAVGLAVGGFVAFAVAVKAAAAVQKIQAMVTAAQAVAAGTATTAQLGLNAAMRANVIGLIITAIALLVTGLIIAYKKSETFRNIVNTGFQAVATVAQWLWNNVLSRVFSLWAKYIGTIMLVWGKLMQAIGKVPGFGWVGDLGDKLVSAGKKARDLDLKLGNATRDRDVRIRIHADNLIVQKGPSGIPVYKVDAPNNAVGTRFWTGGPTWVGEREAEIVIPPRGSQILSGARAAGLAARGGSSDSFAASQPIVLQMDGREIWRGLLKVKRESGNISLGLA